MAFYDTPGLTYDSGVLYDDVIAPTTKGKKMAKVKLNLSRLSDGEIIQKCSDIKTALTGNATFATPTPTLTAFGTLITTAQAKLTTSDNAQTASKQATSDRCKALCAPGPLTSMIRRTRPATSFTLCRWTVMRIHSHHRATPSTLPPDELPTAAKELKTGLNFRSARFVFLETPNSHFPKA